MQPLKSRSQVETVKAIVVGVGLKSEPLIEIKESLNELSELAVAAELEVVGAIVQVLPAYNPATLIGTGKVQEIKEMVASSGAKVVIVDHTLSGVQGRNLQSEIGVEVLDRSQLILDIFAQRARTYEGKLQVELAQMLDQLPRMVGAWLGSLSRQGGGIGTRGPGETALENDRRRIKERVRQIRKQLEGVSKHRSQHRELRRKNQIPSFALIGYTNTGKSTLLNQLTHAQVLTKDQPFATLDPTTRRVELPEIGPVVVTDTVGFIRKLPTHLIEAFKATLEESAEADVLLHVVDLSNPLMEKQIQVVQDLIHTFGWDKKPLIHVFNKMDKAPPQAQFLVKQFPRVFISAKTGEGLGKLKNLMMEAVKSFHTEVELFFPREMEHRIYDLGRESQISRKESASAGTICYASMTPAQVSRWKEFIVHHSL